MPADRSSSVSRRSFLRIATTAAVAVPIVTEAHLAWAYANGAQSASNGVKRAGRFHGGIQRQEIRLPGDFLHRRR